MIDALAGESGSPASRAGCLLRRRRWLRWTLVALAGLAALTLGVWLATPWYVGSRLLPGLWDRYGLTVTVERQDLSVVDGAAVFFGVRVFDGKEELLSAERIEMRVSLWALYEGRTVFERVVFDAPVLHARLGSDGFTNLRKILERRAHDRTGARPAILWKEVLVHRGSLVWEDRVRGETLHLRDIEIAVLDMETGVGERRHPFGQITLDAQLEQPGLEAALLSIVHWTTSSGAAGPHFVVHLALTGLDLGSISGYVDAAQRSALGVDRLDLVMSMEVGEGKIRRGAVVATSPERTRPLTLLFGGPFDDPVFDRSSRLSALLEAPFSRLGRLGGVVWETGGAVVGGVIGAVDGIVHGDLLEAGELAVGGVSGAIESLDSNAVGALASLGRMLGLVAPEEARDTAAIHAHQRALFRSAREEAAREERLQPPSEKS